MFEEISDLSEQIATFLSSDGVCDDDNVSTKRKEQQSTFFGVILYPDEDPYHLAFFNYISMRPVYEKVWIRHDADSSSDSKSHIHMMVHTLDRMTPGSFVKFFDPWIKHAEVIRFPKTYIQYMLHDTPQAINDGKKLYSIYDLNGDEKLWKHLIQNSNFVQLEELLKYHHDGASFLDTYRSIPVDRRAQLGEFMHRDRFFIRNVIEDENSKFYRWLSFQGGHPYPPAYDNFEKNEREENE